VGPAAGRCTPFLFVEDAAAMSLSFSGRLRRRVAEMLWPHAFEPPPPPKELLGLTYAADGLMTQHSSDFLDDPRFQRAYAAGKATGSWWDHDLQWRAYVICWAAERGAALDGDFVECGVHRGGYSRMLADYVGLAARPEKSLYLVDTYRGVPERFRSEEQEGMLAGLYDNSY
jgi:hypothetical protein